MVTLLKKRKVSQNAFDEIGCKIFSVPTRSTTLNPIKLNIVRRQLKELPASSNTKDNQRNLETFSARIVELLKNFPIEIIDKTIESIPNGLILRVKE